MIKTLRLQNFRRHSDTELLFDDNAQIVLVAGQNGVGKTTLLEAIVYALYGEGRHGRRNLDRLVRWGAEYEGLEVEMTFTAGDVLYRVQRKRLGKTVTALLAANDVVVAEGNDAVTNEVSALFGLDAAGFRLAVVAQQKQLDGLASMRSAERAAMLSRLLRLDSITRARDVARSKYKKERDIVIALKRTEDEDAEIAARLATAEQELADVEALLVHATAELAEAQAAVVGLDWDDATWLAAQQLLARAQGGLDGACVERDRLAAIAQSLVVPEVAVRTTRPVAAIRAELSSLDVVLRTAENTQRLLEQREVLAKEEETLNDSLAALSGSERPDGDRQTIIDTITAQEALLSAAQAEIETLREQRGGLAAQRAGRVLDVDRIDKLGATCGQCGQEVGEEHRALERSRAVADLSALDEELEALDATVETTAKTITSIERKLSIARAQLSGYDSDLSQHVAAEESRATASRRLRAVREQLERLVDVVAVDVADVSELQKELQQEEKQSLVEDAAEATRAELVVQHARAVADVAAANARVESAQQAVADASLDAELVAKHNQYAALTAIVSELREKLSGSETQVARSTERVLGLQAAKQAAEARHATRRMHEEAAVVASNTADVLDQLSATMTTKIRPTLEGSISALLAELSNGRFAKAKLDDDYNVSVLIDDEYRMLSDCSGGEADLIALATRLALAGVIADAQAAAGPGFLILDEVFGSQDKERRLAITSALRNLKGIYGQVFLISHVGGLEEDADQVIDIERRVDDGVGARAEIGRS